jgi:hypothetical protein
VPTVAGSLCYPYWTVAHSGYLLLTTAARNDTTPAIDMIHMHGDC